MTHARLPAAPLRRVLLRLRDNESLTWEELADRAGITSRHLFRLLAARTVSELVADRVSCRIGLHPALLWPKEWFRQEHPRRSGRSHAEDARTKVVFTCSPEDASALERHFDPDLSAYDLSHLSTFQVACRPCVGGGQAQAFTFRTEPLRPGSPDRAEAVRRRSAELFAIPRDEVEDGIYGRQAERARTLVPPTREEAFRRRSVGPSVARSAGRLGHRGAICWPPDWSRAA